MHGRRWQWEGAIRASGLCAPRLLMPLFSVWSAGLTFDQRAAEVCAEQIVTAMTAGSRSLCLVTALKLLLGFNTAASALPMEPVRFPKAEILPRGRTL